MIKKCLVCGLDLWTTPSRVKRGMGKFCSKKCYGEWSTINRRGERAAAWRGATVSLNCDFCGKIFHRQKSKLVGKNVFCSRSCLGKWNSKNRAGFNSHKWNPNRVHGSQSVRRSGKYYSWRLGVFKRDGFCCARCGDGPGGYKEAHHLESFDSLMSRAVAAFPDISIYDAAMSFGDMWAIGNGETLCKECHAKIHKKEK